MEAAAWGLIGTFVGALSSIGTTWLATRTSYKVQGAKLADERIERAKAFQRETLLSLQEEVHDAIRLSVRAHLADSAAFRESGSWGRRLLPNDLDEDFRVSRRKVVLLIERVADDSLRSEVSALMTLANEAGYAKSLKDAESAQVAMFNKATRVMGQMGTVLRRHY